ncbi:hypothetical protein LguiB_035962 [Lonicera macranthoides]
MLSPFAEPVSRLLEFPERRKSFVSIRERVVRAGLPPCLPATPPNRIQRRKPLKKSRFFPLTEPSSSSHLSRERPPLEGGIAFCIDWRTGPASQDRKSLLLWTKKLIDQSGHNHRHVTNPGAGEGEMSLYRFFVQGSPMHSGKGVRPPTQMRGVRWTPVPPPKGSERHLLRCTSWPLASARLNR